MTGGRPLRFLLVTTGGWTVMRVAMLLPAIDPTAPLVARADARPDARPTAIMRQAEAREAPHALAALSVSIPEAAPFPRTFADSAAPPLSNPQLANSPSQPVQHAPGAQSPVWPVALPTPAPPIAAPLPVAPAVARTSRLAGSAWTVLRGGSGDASFAGGRLGGAQAGMRLTYALGEARRLALAGRVSSPLAGRGREAALGLDWRPTRLPLHLVAEQRIALDRGATSGPAVALIGGLDPSPVAAGFRLEGYGQAGAVARVGAFADGALRLARPVAVLGPARLDVGAGAWGGAQRGAARLDIGPAASLTVPLADRAIRLTLDWRQRVAGRAAPGSGPVLAIGSDF